jgi:uncharacterized membrane protein
VPNVEQGSESGSAERLVFFSDAVVAIAITLLAIDLPVPTGDTAHEFWLSVRHNDGHYLAFVISFAAIAVAWSHHHEAFRYLRRVDPRFRTLNMAWLMMIVLTPFATKLLTSSGNETLDVHALRFGFYALLQVLSTGVMLAMVRDMRSHRLQATDTPSRVASDANWGSYTNMLGFGLSIPVFFATTSAWVLWFLVPLVVMRTRDRFNRSAPDPGSVPAPAPAPGSAPDDGPAPAPDDVPAPDPEGGEGGEGGEGEATGSGR